MVSRLLAVPPDRSQLPTARSSAANGGKAHRGDRRRDRDSFRVVPQGAQDTEQVYAVVGPTGVALYTFTNLHEATAEAAALNKASTTDRGSDRPQRLRSEEVVASPNGQA